MALLLRRWPPSRAAPLCIGARRRAAAWRRRHPNRQRLGPGNRCLSRSAARSLAWCSCVADGRMRVGRCLSWLGRGACDGAEEQRPRLLGRVIQQPDVFFLAVPLLKACLLDQHLASLGVTSERRAVQRSEALAVPGPHRMEPVALQKLQARSTVTVPSCMMERRAMQRVHCVHLCEVWMMEHHRAGSGMPTSRCPVERREASSISCVNAAFVQCVEETGADLCVAMRGCVVEWRPAAVVLPHTGVGARTELHQHAAHCQHAPGRSTVQCGPALPIAGVQPQQATRTGSARRVVPGRVHRPKTDDRLPRLEAREQQQSGRLVAVPDGLVQRKRLLRATSAVRGGVGEGSSVSPRAKAMGPRRLSLRAAAFRAASAPARCLLRPASRRLGRPLAEAGGGCRRRLHLRDHRLQALDVMPETHELCPLRSPMASRPPGFLRRLQGGQALGEAFRGPLQCLQLQAEPSHWRSCGCGRAAHHDRTPWKSAAKGPSPALHRRPL
mmetsp:Transcript_116196/g.339883  ORF Transcript_116196/g.339883 Transcript_116196/m.339883 type:complete len:498 (-) Transcript_116196:7-1500(-)